MPATDDDVAVVRAAGGVVCRWAGGTLEILVVHRPKYDDWSLPKGKADAGETDEHAARREVEEETGLRCALGPEIGTVRYLDRNRRPKVVRYWRMEPEGDDGAGFRADGSLDAVGGFVANDEVDSMRWCTLHEADAILTYDRDRALLHGMLPTAP